MKVVGSASNTPSPISAIFAARAFHFACVFQRHSIAMRKLLGDLKPDVVPRVLVLAAGIAETNDQLHSEGLITQSLIPNPWGLLLVFLARRSAQPPRRLPRPSCPS